MKETRKRAHRPETEPLAGQVRHNCDVSDARNAGLYSVCGLALRLRDLYKWAHRLEPWEEREPGRVLEWIGHKESLWEKLADEEFMPLQIGGGTFEPFDNSGINAILKPLGLVYGSGYAQSLKPTFFLAFVEKTLTVGEIPVDFLGQELARDLLTLPAMNQDGRVLLRLESARHFLWDQITYIRKSGRPALAVALRSCGISDPKPETLQKHFPALLEVVSDLYVYHEVGEMAETDFDRDLWREMLAAFPHSRVELAARSIKDLLADTHPQGTLPRIVAERRTGALAFYAAFFDGLRKELFPELRQSFTILAEDGDWTPVEEAVKRGYENACRGARDLMAIYREGRGRADPEWTAREVDRVILGPVEKKGGPATMETSGT